MSWGSDVIVDSERDDLWHWLTRYTISRSDALVCDCEAVKRKVQTLLPAYGDERIVRFPWGVEQDVFRPARGSSPMRRRLGWEDAFVLVSIRTWDRLRGLDVLLEAFRGASARCSALRLFLLGDGPLASTVQRFLEDHNLGALVERPGRVSETDLVEYLRAADLYVSCSRSDGSSVSLLQAMATGLPVLVSDVPGNREWVEAGRNGWLAPAGDAKAFAVLIEQAAAQKLSDRRAIGQANRGVIEARADWPRNFERLLKAYERLKNACSAPVRAFCPESSDRTQAGR
jgi:glycosyltransferase involved in cell wall biosynthesis